MSFGLDKLKSVIHCAGQTQTQSHQYFQPSTSLPLQELRKRVNKKGRVSYVQGTIHQEICCFFTKSKEVFLERELCDAAFQHCIQT